MTEVTVSDNAAAHRFEAVQGDEVAAFAEYKLQSEGMLFTHTEVTPKFEGKGVASKLAQFALADVRARGLQAIPACSFISGYIRKHPEYLDLVSEGNKRAYGL